MVDVESHDEVNDEHEKRHIEHDVKHRRGEIIPEINDVVTEKQKCSEVKYSHNESLAPVLFDRVPEIAPDKDGFCFDHVAADVGSADVDKTEREEKKRRQTEEEESRSRVCGDRNLNSEDAVKRGHNGRFAEHISAVERSKLLVIRSRRLNAEITCFVDEIKEYREVTENHQKIDGYELVELSPDKLKEIGDVGVVKDRRLAFVNALSVEIVHSEPIEFFWFLFVFGHIFYAFLLF